MPERARCCPFGTASALIIQFACSVANALRRDGKRGVKAGVEAADGSHENVAGPASRARHSVDIGVLCAARSGRRHEEQWVIRGQKAHCADG